MPKVWHIEEAKHKLGEVVERAIESGPRILTRCGVKVAVVLSYPEYLQRKEVSLSEFFGRSPLGELDLERDQSLTQP